MPELTDAYAGRLNDDWLIARLGAAKATRLAATSTAVAYALFRRLGESEVGMLRAFEIAKHLPATKSEFRLPRVLRRFPPSPKLAVALVDLALHSVRRGALGSSTSHPHVTLERLPELFDDVTGALDLLDAIEPAWEAVRRRRDCRECVEKAWNAAALAVERAHARRPEPAVVVATLMSRRRGKLAHFAALRVAAHHVLPSGKRALGRFCVLEPELARSEDGVAAAARQRGDRPLVASLETRDPLRAVEEALGLPSASCQGLAHDPAAAAQLLGRLFPKGVRLPPRLAVDLWQCPDARDGVVDAFVRTGTYSWSARCSAVEREAASRGLSAAGLFERIALALIERNAACVAVRCDLPAQTRTVIELAVRRCTPAEVARVLDAVEDIASFAIYKRALEAEPRARVTDILAAIAKAAPEAQRTKTFLAWLDGIRGTESA